MLSEEDFKTYLAEMNAYYEGDGYSDLEFGRCPLLRAEHLEVQAEGVVLEVGEAVTGIKPSQVIASLEYKKVIDAYIGLVVAATPKEYFEPPRPESGEKRVVPH